MEFDDYEKLPSGSVGIHMSAGAVAGIFEHIVMYPVDSVKTRMQSLAPSPEASYRSVRDGLTKMITTEGVMRPVRGVNAVILGAGPAHALYFSAYEGIKKFGAKHKYSNDYFVNASAGCGATLVHDAIMGPADVIKQRLQMYNSPYTSSLVCFRDLYKTEGIRPFYRSYTTQLAMNVPHHAVLIIIYEKIQTVLNPSKQYNALVHCTAGATAGAIGAAITNPLDVCKTLLNTQESSTLSHLHQSRVTGIMNAFRTIYMMQGMSGFCRGMQARVIYQMPSTAVAWSVYELFKHYLMTQSTTVSSVEGNELVVDGVVSSVQMQSSEKEHGGGWGDKKAGLDGAPAGGGGGGGGSGNEKSGHVQEKSYTLGGTVERLRTLHVGSSLTVSCSAAAAATDDKLLVK